MAEEVGVAFVRLVPSMRGFGPEAQRALNDATQGPADAAGQEAGGRFGGAFTTALAGAGILAGAVLVGGITEALDQGRIIGKLRAQLGATPAEAKRYGEIAGDLYANAVTQDFQGAADAIKATMKSGLLPPDATNAQIESVSTKVADLANTFDQDLGGVTNAVSQLMRTGLADSADEAFDLISAGFGTSANKADDFLDTINEYSVQFKRVGLDGATAIGLIDQALAAGARDSDQVADALGQFGERALAGGKAVDDAYTSIGLNADDVAVKIGKGGKSAEDALQMTLDALRGTTDEQVKLNAAAALFGDPANVMGDALFAMDPAGAAAASGMDKAKGATDALGDGLRDNAGVKVDQFKRKLQQGFVEFLGNQVIPAVAGFVGFLADHQGELKLFASVITAVVVPALLILGGRAMWAGLQMARAWVIGLGPIGWTIAAIAAVVVLVIAYWDEIVAATLTAWAWVVDKVIWAKDALVSAFLNFTLIGLIIKHWSTIRSKTLQWWNAIVDWVKGIPGMLYRAFLNWTLLGLVIKHWSAIKTATVKKALEMVSWVRGLPGRVSRAIGSLNNLLYGKGQDVVRGLWNGIRSMGGWLRSTLIGWAKDMIPGPIAKALGIGSPSKLMAKAIGRWLPPGIVMGAEDELGEITALGRRTATAATAALTGHAATGRPAAAAAPTVVIDAHGMPRALVEWLRNAIRSEAGGSAERFFKPAV